MITTVIAIAALGIAALALAVAANAASEHDLTLDVSDDLFHDHEERIAGLELETEQLAGYYDVMRNDDDLSPEAYAALTAGTAANEEDCHGT